MTEAETAYRAAQEKIARVAATGETKLGFHSEAFGALDRLPPELAALTGLRTLTLDNTQVPDLAPLAALTGLETLALNSTQVADLAPLTALTGLKRLYLIGTQVADLTPLAALTGLKTLCLDRTQVADLAPLAALTGLENLTLTGTQVADLAPLAALTGLQTLSLASTQVADLAPLAALTGLQALYLSNTQVADLAPLAALTGLENLLLDNTLVGDLRPIAGLDELRNYSSSVGLSYRLTPATRRDARLAALSVIEDTAERTRETLAYLRSLPPWPEPYAPAAPPQGEPPPPPEQDPALPLTWGERGFDFLARSIDGDPVTEAVLDDLRPALEDLRRKGNQHDDLYRIAGELQERSAGPVADLHMVKLHLSYLKLRRLHSGREGRENRFDDETVSTIDAVLDLIPRVTLSDPGVRVLIERQDADRAQGLPEAQAAAAARVLAAVQEDAAPFTPEVKDVAREIARPGHDDRLAASGGILSHNVVVSVLTVVASKGLDWAIGGPVGNYVYDHGADLLAYAATMGDDALFWAQSVLSRFRVEYELAMGVAKEVSDALPRGRGSLRRPERPKG